MAFIDTIYARAKADKKTIVLPESMDKRTYEAAEKILKEGIANLVIIGTPEEIEKYGKGYDISGATIDPKSRITTASLSCLLVPTNTIPTISVSEPF